MCFSACVVWQELSTGQPNIVAVVNCAALARMFFDCCGETMRMGVPARHRPPEADSGEAGGPAGNRKS
jgi:hypothetical protein